MSRMYIEKNAILVTSSKESVYAVFSDSLDKLGIQLQISHGNLRKIPTGHVVILDADTINSQTRKMVIEFCTKHTIPIILYINDQSDYLLQNKQPIELSPLPETIDGIDNTINDTYQSELHRTFSRYENNIPDLLQVFEDVLIKSSPTLTIQNMQILASKVFSIMRSLPVHTDWKECSFLPHGIAIQIDTGSKLISAVRSKSRTVHLTPAESKALTLLMNNVGHLISRDLLYDYVYPHKCHTTKNQASNNITMLIKRLRTKLNDCDRSLSALITTQPNEGFIIHYMYE